MHGIWVPINLFLSLIFPLILIWVALKSSRSWIHSNTLEIGYSISWWLTIWSCGELLGKSICAGSWNRFHRYFACSWSMSALSCYSIGRLSLLSLFRQLSNRIIYATRRSCWVLLVNWKVSTLRLVTSRSCATRLLLVINHGCFESWTSKILILITDKLTRPLGTHSSVHRVEILLILGLRWQILCRHVMIFAMLIRSHIKFVVGILLVSSRCRWKPSVWLVKSLFASVASLGISLRNSLVVNLSWMRSTLPRLNWNSLFFILRLLVLLSGIETNLWARRLLRSILAIKILTMI